MSEKSKAFAEGQAPYAAPRSTARGDTLKVRKIGNSGGVVLTREMLGKLGVEVGDDLQVVRTAKGIELTPFDSELEDALKWIEKGAKRYRNTLRALSK